MSSQKNICEKNILLCVKHILSLAVVFVLNPPSLAPIPRPGLSIPSAGRVNKCLHAPLYVHDTAPALNHRPGDFC